MTNPHRADCGRCAALCCVLTSFSEGDAFAFAKAAGTPCRHLDGHRCAVHSELGKRGLRGCQAFGCFGAGQRATEALGLHGHAWGSSTLPPGADEVFGALCVVQYCRWLLHEASQQGLASADLRAEEARLAHLAEAPSSVLEALDIGDLCGQVANLLEHPSGPDHRFADLHGADLRGADLRGANLAFADLRSAQLHGADLSTARFCSQASLDLAHGDLDTRLPPGCVRPLHWHPSRA